MAAEKIKKDLVNYTNSTALSVIFEQVSKEIQSTDHKDDVSSRIQHFADEMKRAASKTVPKVMGEAKTLTVDIEREVDVPDSLNKIKKYSMTAIFLLREKVMTGSEGSPNPIKTIQRSICPIPETSIDTDNVSMIMTLQKDLSNCENQQRETMAMILSTYQEINHAAKNPEIKLDPQPLPAEATELMKAILNYIMSETDSTSLKNELKGAIDFVKINFRSIAPSVESGSTIMDTLIKLNSEVKSSNLKRASLFDQTLEELKTNFTNVKKDLETCTNEKKVSILFILYLFSKFIFSAVVWLNFTLHFISSSDLSL